MTLEDRCKHGKLTKITERQRECVHQGDNKTHGKQGKRCWRGQENRICKEEGIASGQQPREHSRDMRRAGLQPKLELQMSILVAAAYRYICTRAVLEYAVLTVGNNPIGAQAAVLTVEDISVAILILILPTATYSVVLWGARRHYYLTELWGKKKKSDYSNLTFSWDHHYNDRYY